ncbi:MAG: FHA domain-containing protein [Chloroflexi bacterium]|jgi:predicted component of type VI protein secretion system|nr:FHA domain-containing protein [Chloroflexota bacterium]
MDDRTYEHADVPAEQILIEVAGPEPGARYILPQGVTTIGRSLSNEITIDDTRISRHHLEIQRLPGDTVIEDLGSTNKTWVNDEPLTGERRLQSGDIIQLADAVTFRFIVEAYAPPPAAQPHAAAPIEPEEARVAVGPGDAPARHPAASSMTATPPPPTEVAPRSSAAKVTPPPAPKPARSKRYYWGIALLVGLLLLCLALAAFLWFAPYEFWAWLFELFGIPL